MIRNECIREKIGVASIVKNRVESRLRWFGHMRRRPVEALIRRVDQMKGNPITRDKGRSRKIISKTIKKDLDVNGLNIN